MVYNMDGIQGNLSSLDNNHGGIQVDFNTMVYNKLGIQGNTQVLSALKGGIPSRLQN